MGKRTLFYLGEDDLSTYEHINNNRLSLYEKFIINLSSLFSCCY